MLYNISGWETELAIADGARVIQELYWIWLGGKGAQNIPHCGENGKARLQQFLPPAV